MHATGDSDDIDRQTALLHLDLGLPGSGAARYAAAMFFYNQQAMPADMLEIYRCCSKFDCEDPLDMARHRRIQIPAVSRRMFGA